MSELFALQDQVTAWAETRADVRAVVVVGSRARSTTPGDQWSDTDLVLVVEDPATFLDDAGWLRAIGEPLLTFVEPTAVGPFAERRVLFEDGEDVDFAVVPVAGLTAVLRDPGAVSVLRRGHRVLLDRIGLEERLRAAVSTSPAAAQVPPRQSELDQLSHDFWYHAIWAAKKLRRGELWMAKQVCDGHCKRLLVQLLAWRAAAGRADVDTWHQGRFLERWASPSHLARFRTSFAQLSEDDLARALLATADLFGSVSEELVQQVGLAPGAPHERARARLADLLAPVTSRA